jgi:hypothetical protein
LATGRVAPLKDEVDIILKNYGLEFDEMHLNPGIDTFEFKSNLFAKLIYELQPEEFIMYDDRQEHLVRFVQWANAMPCKVTIIDAISGEEFKSEQDPLIESIKRILRQETELTEKCWKGYTQKGMKTMFGKRYPNCVKKTKLQEHIRKVLREETNLKPVLHNLLNMLFDGFDDMYYDWAEFNCGMGVCCDPYAIGFILPKNEYNDYLFKLVDGVKYDLLGNYPSKISDELPEVCYESPDIRNPKFNTIVFYEVFAEEIENYLGPQMNWKESLLNLINDKFGCNAWELIII